MSKFNEVKESVQARTGLAAGKVTAILVGLVMMLALLFLGAMAKDSLPTMVIAGALLVSVLVEWGVYLRGMPPSIKDAIWRGVPAVAVGIAMLVFQRLGQALPVQ